MVEIGLTLGIFSSPSVSGKGQWPLSPPSVAEHGNGQFKPRQPTETSCRRKPLCSLISLLLVLQTTTHPLL